MPDFERPIRRRSQATDRQGENVHMSENVSKPLPVVPMRNAVLFPGVTFPISAGRSGTLRAIEAALASPDHRVFAVAQRSESESVTPSELYTIGTIATIGSVQRGLGGIRLVLDGKARGIALRLAANKQGFLEATVQEASEMLPLDPRDPAFAGLHREARERAAELGKKLGLPEEAVDQILAEVDEPGRLADLVAGYLDVPVAAKQVLLETLSVEDRLRRVLVHVQRQVDVLSAQEEIQSRVKEEIGSRQREMYLREQLKAIQKELGETDGASDESLKELRAKLDALELPQEARKEIDREWQRLTRIGRESMESQVIRTYLETVAELPWNARSDEKLDVPEAARILDEDHFGLKDVKDRILEFLAVRQLGEERAASVKAGASATASADGAKAEPKESARRSGKGRILLFAGPPGVGKTSIAKSIARAMGRKYVRISLGGARDEADIRGHRRTYIGAMPGRILQGMKQAGSKNPVFLLDEVDKLGVSYQGDPASALLEVLDPAQNDSLHGPLPGRPVRPLGGSLHRDGQLRSEHPGTAARPDGDRELRRLHGGGEAPDREELPRAATDRGERAGRRPARPDRAAIREVIASYTRESGVRQLERELGKLARKVARRIAAREIEKAEIRSEDVRPLLGRPHVHPEKMSQEDQVGVATGMYYTPAGGDIMFVEASLMRGKGELILTGQLGDVMKESARAAWTFARSHAPLLGIDEKDFERDIHIHVPAGAIPKDGPSAGIAMASAVASALSRRAVRNDVAMTGEITLSGRVLPIGGLKEKILGAVRAGIRSIVIPRDNEADLEDLSEAVRAQIEVLPVTTLSEALAVTLRDASLENGRLTYAGSSAADTTPQ